MFNLCPPALIYLFFCATQIIIDIYKGLYNTAFFKFIIMIMITILLNALCQQGLGIVSWMIVFIPFIFMTVVVTILLYVFGLNAATGTIETPIPPPPPPVPSNQPPPKPYHVEEKQVTVVNPYPLHGMSKYSTINVYELQQPPPPPSSSSTPPPPPPPSSSCPPPPKPTYCIPKPPPNGTSSPAYQSIKF
jgi:hypothetical protein